MITKTGDRGQATYAGCKIVDVVLRYARKLYLVAYSIEVI